MVFGHQLRYFLPVLLHKYEPAKHWSVTQEYTERTLAQKRGVRWVWCWRTIQTLLLVRVDGSRMVTLRNRNFVKPLNPNMKTPVSPRPQPLEHDVEKPVVENDVQRNKSRIEVLRSMMLFLAQHKDRVMFKVFL